MLDRFEAYDPDNGTEDDARLVMALDAQDAAAEFAKDADHESAEYTYASFGGYVMVRPAGGNEPWQCFEVTAETRPVYYASAVKGGPRA